jgi:hypothetical protein
MFVYSNTALSADSNFAPTRRSNRYVYLGGIPDTITNTTITITANDEVGQSVSNNHVISYKYPTVSTTVPSSSIVLPLTATNRILMTATGGYGNISYELTGTLPTGLTFISSNAAIMGTPDIQEATVYTVTAVSQSSGVYFSNASAEITITAVDGTAQNVMSFNLEGSGFDEMDPFTWQGLAPLGSATLALSSTTPFTIEFWIKGDYIPSAFIINTDTQAGGYNGVNFWYNNGECFFSITGSGQGSRISTSSVDIFDNQWHHVALVRNGNSGKIYIDGYQEASTTSWGGLSSTLNLAFIGNYRLESDVFFGKLSNFRLTKTALYTASTYTVPTLPLVPIANTVLLLNTPVVDDSSNSNTTVIELNVAPTYEIDYIPNL